ncbi:50S ribosomal protein L25 [bacterium]|nr:50S ribosomal protein L25 [bacterium]MBU1025867.1 50S ribosomal protein L25 [bacterium]
MELQKMNATTRKDTSKPARIAARKDGFVPSVIYGGGEETISLALNEKVWQKLFDDHGSRNMILDLLVDDSQDEPELVKIGEVQRHPIKGYLIHVDLIRLARGVKAIFEVGIRFIGKAQGEKEGGILMKHLDFIELECLPRDVPDAIEINITPFQLHQGMRVGEIPWDNEEVKLLTEDDRLIFSIEVPKVVEEAVAEEVEGEEGAEDESEEGEEKKGHEKSGEGKKHSDEKK